MAHVATDGRSSKRQLRPQPSGDLLALGQPQRQTRPLPLRRSDPAGPGQKWIDRRRIAIEHPPDRTHQLPALPAIPDLRLLLLREIDPSAIAHPEHSIFSQRLKCCGHPLNPPPKADTCCPMQLAENTRFRPGDTGRPNADGVDPPGVADCQARPGELVDQRHQPHAPAVIGSTFDKVEAPDMMGYSGRSRMQDPSLSQSLLLIASRTRAIDASSAVGSIDEALGPHCAVKRILYANGSRGVLLYFKSSLTGDEQDYILDYKKRNPASPHETTGDFFRGTVRRVSRARLSHGRTFFRSRRQIRLPNRGGGGWRVRECARSACGDPPRIAPAPLVIEDDSTFRSRPWLWMRTNC